MEQNNDLFAKIESVYQHILLYAKQSKDIVVLELTEKASRIITDIVSSIFIFILSMIILLFASIALAWHIGLSIDNLPLGFLIVALIYFITLLILFTVNKGFIKPKLIDYFVKQLLHGYSNQES